ncbi:hypothetical protein GF312_16250 [Candidatus Poribacteria bacterium]|nr:hypothetical protein [Candidatus Poribacteria bacterium]
MFGNNQKINEVRKELSDYAKVNNNSIDSLGKMIVDTQKQITELHKSLIQIAKIQAQHKQAISFLLNNSSMNAGCVDDFVKMLEGIGDIEKEVKSNKGEKEQ